MDNRREAYEKAATYLRKLAHQKRMEGMVATALLQVADQVEREGKREPATAAEPKDVER